jgi:methylenetetrahydrofolate reductase (NADPH)
MAAFFPRGNLQAGREPDTMMKAGIAYAVDQIVDPIASSMEGIHIYTLNKPQVAEKIMNNLRDIL